MDIQVFQPSISRITVLAATIKQPYAGEDMLNALQVRSRSAGHNRGKQHDNS